MSLLEDVFDVGIEFSDAIFGFGTGNETFGLMSAGARIFSGALGENMEGMGGGSVPGVAGGDLYDLVDPGFGGQAGGGSGLLARQMAQQARARPRSDFWSNPFVGNIAGAVGQALLQEDPAEQAGRIAEERHQVAARNYRLPRRRVTAPAPEGGA